MAAAQKPTPQWVIDTHGMVEALTTKQNSVKAAIIDAIESGAMLILKVVSKEISDAYPGLWASFKAINRKKYLPVSIAMINAANTLSEAYGASVLGSMPSGDHFESVAAARMKKCTLVTANKALQHCTDIATTCKLPAGCICAVADVA